ncbi:hypothetical protein K438DRAFT_1910300 [Mycena galopus ATCC 62051]|nr:hypothetical protein K438DRAFT_1910300 [Mycena galopus ATCC 62051]
MPRSLNSNPFLFYLSELNKHTILCHHWGRQRYRGALEYVTQLSADSKNTVFAIVRNKATATELTALSRNNIEVLEADVTDAQTLKLAANEVSKFKTNTIGAVHATNAFLPLLKNGTDKKVISITSALADLDVTLIGAVGEPSYAISKAALNMVVPKYAAQYKAEGFTFLAICPGMVITSMLPSNSCSLFTLDTVFIPHHCSRNQCRWRNEDDVTTEESVKMQLEVINGWTVEESGAFVSHFGNKQWI